MFNPGETIAHVFVIPFNHDNISKVIVTYKDLDSNVFYMKSITSDFISQKSEQESDKSIVRVQLSQDESLLFREYSCFKIQLNVITTSIPPCRFSSKEMNGHTGPQHVQEVIS